MTFEALLKIDQLLESAFEWLEEAKSFKAPNMKKISPKKMKYHTSKNAYNKDGTFNAGSDAGLKLERQRAKKWNNANKHNRANRPFGGGSSGASQWENSYTGPDKNLRNTIHKSDSGYHGNNYPE